MNQEFFYVASQLARKRVLIEVESGQVFYVAYGDRETHRIGSDATVRSHQANWPEWMSQEEKNIVLRHAELARKALKDMVKGRTG
jgi:hypothetical protein